MSPVSRKTFGYTITPDDGGWWVVEIPELNRVTQVKDPTHAVDAARDAIALWLDVPEDSFDLHPI